jgi:signal transduction histidine kinase
MRRVRIALLLLFLALAIPAGLLVQRALQSAELERRVRHEAIAQRVFDEMERALSLFLEREEARSAADYRFYSWLDESAADAANPVAAIRSPLSRSASDDFVLLHFQVDPDGSVHTPLRPRDEALAERRGDWPVPADEQPRLLAALDLLEDDVIPFWQAARASHIVSGAQPAEHAAGAPEAKEADPFVFAQEAKPRRDAGGDPGARAALAKVKPGRAQADLEEALADADAQRAGKDDAVGDGRASAYDVLQSLNRGAEQRRARKQVVTEAPRSKAFSPPEIEEDEQAGEEQLLAFRSSAPLARAPEDRALEGQLIAPRLSDEAAPQSRPAPSAASPRGSQLSYRAMAPSTSPLPGPIEAESTELDDAATSAAPPHSASAARLDRLGSQAADSKEEKKQRAEQPVRIIVEPMVGQALGWDLLMLYRTVLVDARGYRQGVVVDRRALGAWLKGEALGESPLANSVQLVFDGAGEAAPALPQDYYASAHTFAEPFGDLSVRLAVPPVRGMGSNASIYLLAGLLGVVTLAGLAAIHRMTSVVVHFAERRSNFVAAVSHELKTPLTAIRMYAEMLRDGLVASEQKRDDYHRAISDESERLSRLIDNVLDFSRLEQGGREMRLVVGSPGDALRDMAERLRPHVEREGFTLDIEIEAELPAVRFDRDALVQVVFNLVDNALKYAAPAENKEIVLGCARGEDGRVVVSVRDHGPGVPRRELRRIFESFYRIEDELTRSAKGSGIGLALVRELGEAMGAIVRGDNAPGGGLRVALSFEPAGAPA